MSQSTVGDLPRAFRNSTLQLVSSMTSSTLVLTVDIDGFQHGDEPLIPKCLAIACDRVEGSYSWLFDTSHLLTRPAANIHTYRYQTDMIHGIPLSSPGLPCDLFPSVLSHTIYDVLLECMVTASRTERPERILLFVKGVNKLPLLLDALYQSSLPIPVHLRSLEDLQCPTINQMCPCRPGRIVSTKEKAIEYALWLASIGIA